MMENRLHAVVALLLCVVQTTSVLASQKSYIIYMGSHSHGPTPTAEDSEIATQSHYDLLGTVLGSDYKAKEAMICSYNKHINGFAAVLSEEEAEIIESYPGVVSVFENKQVKLQTTHSWEFLGLEENGVPTKQSLWTKSNYGTDIIIGTLDSGIWPESDSFNDHGFGPVPSRWKGACFDGSPTNKVRCNNKLIGARYFYTGYEHMTGVRLSSHDHSARDTNGHGTHALSTAGGNFVAGANILGNDYGTAKGGSPNARVAAYKVCWPLVDDVSCAELDILNAFDAAIADGVDVLSVSLGGVGEPVDYIKDSIAIGAFHAMQHGITVVAAAGNYGPRASTVSNTAPWILTVGSSTMDREFANWVSFDGKYYKTLHPDWSSAAIRSAIMTTAMITDNHNKRISLPSGKSATPLDYGSGLVSPNEAANPGLVYDLAEDDYLNFLCAKGYSEEYLIRIARKPYKCPRFASLLDLNYPSIAVPNLKGSVDITREVKNVGRPGIYTVKVRAPAGVLVMVEPMSLKFDQVGEVKKFSVSLKAMGTLSPDNYVFGRLVWSDGKHKVRSPIAVAGA